MRKGKEREVEEGREGGGRMRLEGGRWKGGERGGRAEEEREVEELEWREEGGRIRVE